MRMRLPGQSGQGAIELALIAGLIAILALGSLWLMAKWLGRKDRSMAAPTTSTREFDTAMAAAAGKDVLGNVKPRNTTSVQTTVP